MSFISSNLYSVFKWVINSSIKVSILIVGVLFIRILIKGKSIPKLNHILWLIVILRILIPDVYKSDLSIYKFVPMVSEGMFTLETNNKSISIETNEEGFQAATEYNANKDDNLYSNKANPPIKEISLRNISFIIWVIGLFIILSTTLIINISFLRKIHEGTVIKHPSIIRLLDRCKEEIGISKNILLIETREAKVLGILGFFFPKILFPKGLIDKLDENNLRYVFLHELSHLKRRDIFINWITSILRAFHWFNPIVWYGFYKMREDSELCCDSLVMTRLKNDETIDYGYTIIKLAENLSARSHMLITASIVSNRSQTKRRIKMIKLFEKNAYKLSAAAILIIVLVGAVAFVGAKRNINSNSNSTDLDEVVVYTTHYNELYKNGISAMEAGKKLAESLQREGFNCTFMEVPPTMDRSKQYAISRDMITSKVKDYSNKVLLDIHIDYGLLNLEYGLPDYIKVQEGMKIVLGKTNPNYKENDEFAELLLKELKRKGREDKSTILVKEGKYNEDLSPKCLVINLGTSNTPEAEMEDYIRMLTTSLKNIMPQLK